jgi:ArsR family transcriptional regulator
VNFLVRIFKALAEESRLRILSLLLQNDKCVCELEACLPLKQSNLSRHLSTLKKSGLLSSYKKSQWVYYKIIEIFIDENPALWTHLEMKLQELRGYDEGFKKSRKFANLKIFEMPSIVKSSLQCYVTERKPNVKVITCLALYHKRRADSQRAAWALFYVV